MPSINHVYRHIKMYGSKHRFLYLLALMVFFWTIFDGIISYVVPVAITARGISDTMMGVILGTSSVAGAGFDFLLARTLTNTHFRRVLFLMFISSALTLFLLWQASSIWLFLIVMAVWGLYYDLYGISLFDFVSRDFATEEHASSFGVVSVFSALGYLIAPLIAGAVIVATVGEKPFVLAGIFLGLALICFIFLWVGSKRNAHYRGENFYPPSSFAAEYRLWKKIGRVILPVLTLTLTLNVIDSFFWTIGPLLSENLSSLHGFGSLFMVAYLLPSLFVGWFVGSITRRIGQKRTAFLSLFVGSLVLSTIYFVHAAPVLVGVSFVASFCMSLAWPSIKGAYGDYIAERSDLGKEIETLQDSFGNLGYIIGPIMAGFISDHLGFTATFSIIGIIGAISAAVLLFVTPQQIRITTAREH